MKKLVAILVISLLAVGLFAVDNPFTFSVSNFLRAKFSDSSQPGYMSARSGQGPYVSGTDSSANDPAKPYAVGDTANLYKAGAVDLYEELKGQASITIAEIYTLKLYCTNKLTVGNTNKDTLVWGMENSIKVVEDYLTIGVNASYEINFVSGSGLTSAVVPKVSLSGSIPDAYLSWEIYDQPKLNFNLYAWAHTNPTRKGYSSETEEGAGYFGTKATSEKGFFESLDNEARIKLDWDFFKYFAPEGITGKLRIQQDMNIVVPYSYYFERYKTLKFDGELAFMLGLAGFGLDLKFLYATADYLATNYGPMYHAGSYYEYNTKTDTGSASDHPSGSGAFTSNVDMPSSASYRPMNGTLQMGPRVAFNFSAGGAKFTFQWTGTASGLRDPDLNKDNSGLKWTNAYEVTCTFNF